jgi:signal transduction histidine kinase
VLTGLCAFQVFRESRALDARSDQVHLVDQKIDSALASMRAKINESSLAVIELSPKAAPSDLDQLRRTLARNRADTSAALRSLTPMLETSQLTHVDLLRKELKDFWDSLDASLAPGETARQRERILEIAGQIDQLNNANVNRQEEEIEQRSREFQAFLRRTALLLLILSVAIAGGVTYYLSRIEREAVRQRERARGAEVELRRLSNQLVKAQEEERKTISRELHDEVGQILTGLRMELGSMQSLVEPAHNPAFHHRLHSVKSLAEEALRSVRNLALLLRPSMLDDLGLPAALRWQAKEFTRRTGIDATVRITGDFDNLPDSHRTCLYRVIQEATTNIARHANARKAIITLTEHKRLLTASVQDDGQGFQPNGFRSAGLGLVGMEERARDLQGRVSIESQPGQGTVVKVELPLPEGILAET